MKSDLERASNHRYYLAHRKQLCAWQRRYRLEHPDKVRQTNRRNYLANREKRIAYQRKYYHQNREKQLAYRREYYETHQDQIKSYRSRPEVMKRHNDSNNKQYRIRKEEVVKLLGGRCSRCGYNKCLAALDIHHIDPSKKTRMRDWVNKATLITNLQILCRNCHAELHEELKMELTTLGG